MPDDCIPNLPQPLKAERADREVRSIACHMKSARFPACKGLAGFDFAASEINEAAVRSLHRCEFLDGAQNVVLIGGPGTERPMQQRPWAFNPSNITAERSASCRPSSRSISWNRRRPRAKPGRSQKA